MLVIDVGAGTTDFAMFARVDREGEMHLFRIKDSVTTIRIAGNDVDDALVDYLMLQAGAPMATHGVVSSLPTCSATFG